MQPVAAREVRRATFMLVLVTLLWGLSFPLVKTWQLAAHDCPGGALQATLTLIALRMLLGVTLLFLWHNRLFRSATRKEYRNGAIIGLLFLSGFVFQVWGMARTSPALSAFLTSLGSAWVPLLGWILYRSRISLLTLAGLAIGVGGTTVLGLGGDSGWSLQGGEGMTLLASVLFAVQILFLDRMGKEVEAAHLTAGFLVLNCVLSVTLATLWAIQGTGLRVWLEWTWSLLCQWRILATVITLAVFPTVLAFHWMNIYQPKVAAGRAALVYLLEPLFAAAFSIPWGLDELTIPLAAGGGLILLGNLAVEWGGQPVHPEAVVTGMPMVAIPEEEPPGA